MAYLQQMQMNALPQEVELNWTSDQFDLKPIRFNNTCAGAVSK